MTTNNKIVLGVFVALGIIWNMLDASSDSQRKKIFVAPVPNVDDTSLDSILAEYDTTLVQCYAPWCGPCHTMAPIVGQVAAQYSGRAAVVKMNIDDPNCRATWEGAEASGVPTLLFYQNGKLVSKHTGKLTAKLIGRQIDSMLVDPFDEQLESLGRN